MTPHSPQLIFAVALLCLMQPAQAANDLPEAAAPAPIRNTVTCHLLMTELECGLHKTTLAQLGPGPLRERYLADHAALLQEREASCACNRKAVSSSSYPSRRQALLSF